MTQNTLSNCFNVFVQEKNIHTILLLLHVSTQLYNHARIHQQHKIVVEWNENSHHYPMHKNVFLSGAYSYYRPIDNLMILNDPYCNPAKGYNIQAPARETRTAADQLQAIPRLYYSEPNCFKFSQRRTMKAEMLFLTLICSRKKLQTRELKTDRKLLLRASCTNAS